MGYLKKEWKAWFSVKSLGLWFILLLAATLVIVIFIKTEWVDDTNGQSAPFTLGLVDLEQDSYTKLLISYFEENDSFSSYIAIYKGTEAEIRELFEAGDLDGWILIPAGFVPGMIAMEHVPMHIVVSGEDTTKTVLLQNLFQSYGHYVTAVETSCMTLYLQMEEDGYGSKQLETANLQISLDLIGKALKRTDFFEYQVLKGEKELPLGVYYGYAFLGLVPFLVGISSGIRLVEERVAGIWNRVGITNGGKCQWFLAKLLLGSVLSIIVVVSLASFLRFVLGEKWSFECLILVAGLCSAIIAVMLCTAFLASSKREYLLSAGMAVLLLAALGGSFIPVDFLPDKMVRICAFLLNRILAKLLAGSG